MIDKLIDISAYILLFAMCSDLLYLYFAHGWYDPIKIIEYSEVILLFVIRIFSLFRFAILVKRLFNEY